MVKFRRAIEVLALLQGVLLALGGEACAETVHVPLQNLTSASTLELRCVSGGQNLSIPVPERWKVTRAMLNLHYMASNNMVTGISQMVVKVNGELITQMKLETLAPGVTREVQIPVSQLKPGYNTLTFQVTQHYLNGQCEQPCAPDLWTNVSLAQSFVQLDYELRPVPLKLGEAANWVFDPKQFPEGWVNIVSSAATPEDVTMMGISASGIARRFDYRKVTFTHGEDIKQGVDNVLVGTTEFAEEVLSRYGLKLEPSDGGRIKVFYVPKKDGGKDGLHALIVVTGNHAAELKVAAETFANMSLPYPGSDEMHTFEFSMADISMYSGRQELMPDKDYQLTTLGMPTSTFLGPNGKPTGKGFSSSVADLSFRLPSDFLIKQNQYAKLALNFSYGAGMRPDSSLSLSLNDKQIRDIHLDNIGGNYIEGYRLEIPTYLFRPGTNTISFRPYLNTSREVCDASNAEGAFVTIFGNSTMKFPPMPHFVEMPKMELFALNGFPFTRWPDGINTQVYLPQHDSGSIDTALNLIGLITQKNGFPLFGTRVVFAEPREWDGELLVIGEAAAIPKSIMALAPLQPQGTANIPYPVSRGWDSETSIAMSRQRAGLGEGSGLLMEFESGLKQGHTIVLATAQTEKDLVALGDALLSPGVQARITGDVSLVKLDAPEYHVDSYEVGKKYSTGDRGSISALDAFLYANPYAFYVLIALALVVMSLLGFWLLRRYRARRVGHDQV